MTNKAFSIKLFLKEGRPDGLQFVEKSNWSGLGIVCPRGRYPTAKARDEFSWSGVYLLVGSDSVTGQAMIYVGEGEVARDRLNCHYVEKDFWQRLLVFTRRGATLNKAEIKYLESRLVEIAKGARRCRLVNGNTPRLPALSESEQADVEGYLDEVLLLLPVLGVTAFERVKAGAARRVRYFFRGNEFDVEGFETSSSFAVRKGSIARREVAPSMEKHVPSDFAKRQGLIEEGALELDEAGYRFVDDHEFSSPSQAAATVAGRSVNGRTDWKDEAGVSLKEHQAREVE